MASAVHFWIAFFGTGLLLVVLAWAGSRRRKLGPKQLAGGNYPAACGSCGYDLTGLPGTTCPECGSDLELVGRLSPQFHRWAAVPVTARLIVWTVAISAFAAAMVYIGIKEILPRTQAFDARTTWTLRHREEGKSLSLTVRAWFERSVAADDLYAYSTSIPSRSSAWLGSHVAGNYSEVDDLPDGTRRVRISGGSSIYLVPGEGQAPEVYDQGLPADRTKGKLATESDARAAIVHVLGNLPHGLTPEEVEAIADELTPQVEQFLAHGALATSGGQGRMVTYGTAPGALEPPVVEPLAIVLAGGFWLLVWALGLPFILRKRPISIRRERNEVPAEPMIPQAGAGVLESAHAGQA